MAATAIRAFSAAARVWLRDAGPPGLVHLNSDVFATALSRAGIVYLGETHEQPEVLGLQMAVLDTLVQRRPSAIHLVLEHFTIPEQTALSRFMMAANDGTDDDRSLQATSEGFSGILSVLRYVRNAASAAGVPLRGYAAFPPREIARKFTKPAEGDAAWSEMLEKSWLPREFAQSKKDALLAGSDSHYAFFESLLTGRDEIDGDTWGSQAQPTTNDSDSGKGTSSVDAHVATASGSISQGPSFRRIFPAQTVKDACMAAVVARALTDLHSDPQKDGEGRRNSVSTAEADASATSRPSSSPGVVVVLAGTGHVDFGLGVPERVAMVFGLPRGHVPTFYRENSSEGDDETGLRQMIVTVRPRPLLETPMPADDSSSFDQPLPQQQQRQRQGRAFQYAPVEGLHPARITFPDGSVRICGDAVFFYRHVDDEPEEVEEV